MNLSFLKKIDCRKPEGIAVILLIAFLVLIHPISTFFGGLFFWIFDRVLSTVIFYCIALWLVGKKIEHKFYRALIAIPVSGVIWLISLMPSLAKAYFHTPDIEYTVHEPLHLESATYIQIKQKALTDIFHDPLKPKIQLNMSEGCNCSYFSVQALHTYNWQLTKKLRTSTGAFPYNDKELIHGYDYYFKVYSLKNNDKKNTSSVISEIYFNKKLIAEFKHKNIPDDIIGKPKGLKQQNWFNLYFLHHAYDMLITGNYWKEIIGLYTPTYFPEQQFDEFLTSAVIIKEQHASQ